MKEFFDIVYKKADGLDLMLDLFMPENVTSPPLIMWIHGGAWLAGNRKGSILLRQVERGYALASIEYRYSTQAIFPALIMDCKDALHYLKTNADKYGYDPKCIAAGGDSAGGHLAALIGTSAGQKDWEQEGADCRVAAVVDYYGPTLVTRKWNNAQKPDSPESILLGEHVVTQAGHARAVVADPATYINQNTPPFLILHGTDDNVVPIDQSIYLRDRLEEAGCKVYLHQVLGGGHGFSSKAADCIVDEFLDFYLKK